MNNEQNNKQKKGLRKLPGFYIALCCCVLVIGLAGYFTERRGQISLPSGDELSSDNTVFSGNIDSYMSDAVDANDVPDSETVSREEYEAETEAVSAQTDEAATDANESSEAVDSSEMTEALIPDYASENPDVEEAAVIVSAEAPDFEFPVSGDILEEYSEVLVFNSALSDWRTHDGIDIAADVGCSVHAAADGTVEDVFTTASGEGVTISHADGVKTKYIGMASLENITVGSTIAAGDVVGVIGESKGETVLEPHLHLEFYKDDIPVNPLDYLK